MKKTRLFFLIQEYRSAQQRLNVLQSKGLSVKTADEILEVLDKDLKDEVQRAAKAKDESAETLYKQAVQRHFPNDCDRPNDQDRRDAAKTLLAGTQSEIIYYETKIRSIRKLMGIRNAELLDNYDEKAMFIGTEASDRRLAEEIEAQEESSHREDPGDFTFGKM